MKLFLVQGWSQRGLETQIESGLWVAENEKEALGGLLERLQVQKPHSTFNLKAQDVTDIVRAGLRTIDGEST